MPFDPKAKITPFISVEGPGKQTPVRSPDRSAVPRKNFSVGSTPRPTDDYEDQIIAMRREATGLINAVEALRTEAERLVSWRDSSEGAPWWGDSQRFRAAQSRAHNFIEAAHLKEIAERQFPGQSQLLFDAIFKIASPFGEAITWQARKELGL
jgi:hypothetical protein